MRRKATRGDTVQFQVQVFQPAPPVGFQPQSTQPAKVPQNIAGWYAWATLKYQWPDVDAQAIAQVTSLPRGTPPGGSIVFTEAGSGIMLVTFPPFATQSFPDGEFDVVYDVQTQDTSSPVVTTTQERGVFTFSPDATRSITQP